MSLHIVPPESKFPLPYINWKAHLSPPEVAEIIRIGTAKDLQPGQIGGTLEEAQTNLDYRSVLTAQVEYNDAPWLFERMVKDIARANGDFWSFDISGLYENMNFLQYDEPTQEHPSAGHYDWHQDIGNGFSSLRKISTVTQLSDPTTYDGCRLHIFSNGDNEVGENAAGTTLMFPSYMPHCITPITRGRRFSLVSWVTGPAFR